jgi:hypothetical protein
LGGLIIGLLEKEVRGCFISKWQLVEVYVENSDCANDTRNFNDISWKTFLLNQGFFFEICNLHYIKKCHLNLPEFSCLAII